MKLSGSNCNGLVGAMAASAALLAMAAAGCTTGSVAESPAPVAVQTTSLTTTTLEPLADVVDVTDRPSIATLPPGFGSVQNVLPQVSAMADGLIGHDGTIDDRPGTLVDALGAGLAESIGAGGCEIAPTVLTSTVGIGPVIGTIDITIGCDPTTDAVQFVVTLQQPLDTADPATAPWDVVGATLAPHCTQGISDGLCV